MSKALDKNAILETLRLLQQDPQEEPASFLNPIYGEICAAMGLDNTIELYLLLKGQQLTFPQSFFQTKSIKAQIRREYNGTNIRELSQKYGRSEKTIRRFLSVRGLSSD